VVVIVSADFGVSSNLDKTLGRNRTVIGTPHFMVRDKQQRTDAMR
jgi:hypothetical protein